jgi:hypothetical protein
VICWDLNDLEDRISEKINLSFEKIINEIDCGCCCHDFPACARGHFLVALECWTHHVQFLVYGKLG